MRLLRFAKLALAAPAILGKIPSIHEREGSLSASGNAANPQ
jgi:hypothetical protein